MSGRELHGVPVLGTSEDLRRLAIVHGVRQALIAIPSITGDKLRRLVELSVEGAGEAGLRPPPRALVTGEVHLTRVREVRIDALLGREPVALDLSGVLPEVAGQTVVVTGAGGSIGSALGRGAAPPPPA